MVSIDRGAPETTTPAQISQSQQGTSKTIKFVDNPNGLRLRYEPSLSAEVLEILKNKTKVEVLTKKDEWTRVKVGSSLGWVASEYLATQGKDFTNEQNEQSTFQLIGQWGNGKHDVFLKKEAGKYIALFEPFLPKESVFKPPMSEGLECTPIYGYLLALIEHDHKTDRILEFPVSLTPHFEERNGTSLIFYQGDNGRVYFLLARDQDTLDVMGVSFWKE